MAIFYGTEADDRIAGKQTANNTILGADGNDTLIGRVGDDKIDGGIGNDKIDGGAGNDVIGGGAGDDILSGGAGNDVVHGGAGNDKIDGGIGDDILTGGEGADIFQFKAGFGQDILTDFTAGEDKLNFYAGSIGNAKNISVYTVADLHGLVDQGFATTSDAGYGAVKFSFGTGDSITFLNLGAEFGFPQTGTPNAPGTSGPDTLFLGPEAGHATGQDGNDIVLGGSGAALLEGNNGDDIVIGGVGDDLIGGQDGNDVLFADGGNDGLSGGPGDDFLSGGTGADIFRFNGAFGQNTITDLSFAEGDSLEFLNVFDEPLKIVDEAGFQAFVLANDARFEGDNLIVTISPTETLTFQGYGPSDIAIA